MRSFTALAIVLSVASAACHRDLHAELCEQEPTHKWCVGPASDAEVGVEDIGADSNALGSDTGEEFLPDTPDATDDADVSALADATDSSAVDTSVTDGSVTPDSGGSSDTLVPIDTGATDVGGSTESATCDPAASPAVAPCVLRDDLGVFVASSGSDTSVGTKAAPVRTLAKALALAKGSSRRVYACAEVFTESVNLADGVSLFGGVNCSSGWTAVIGRTTINAPTSPAITASAITSATRLEGFDVRAPNVTVGSASSIGLFVIGSSNLRVDNCSILAGNAASGVDGLQGADGAKGVDGGKGGDSGLCSSGAASPGVGGSGVTLGGKGGSACSTSTSGTDGALSSGGCGLGALFVSGGSCGLGGAGKDGCPGTTMPKDGDGGTNLGTVDVSGYLPTNHGTDGSVGTSGGGGGGGASGDKTAATSNSPAAGGGGGGGGGGGAGGKGGTAGGASLGVLSVDSNLQLSNVSITSKAGGDGARGGLGGPGGLGGAGGAGGSQLHAYVGPGCSGGKGGAGTAGGFGGGGGGGPSIAIAYRGTAPIRLSVDLTSGSAGAGGLARAGASPSSAGKNGIKADVLAF